jgi:cytochrome b subunit of formate dehydrogenase
MFDIVQRLFHWANFMLLGLMALTGVALFLPGLVDAFLAPLGIRGFASKVYWHVTLAWGLLALIVIHVVWDTLVARGWGNIWPTRRDFSDAQTRARNFLGLSHDYPRSPKYDLFMKGFHWSLTVSLIILGITGLYFWNPYGLFPELSYNTELLFRLLHDFFAFLLLGLIIGHMYFALIPANWPILTAMAIGYIKAGDYLKHFGMTKWKPKAYKMAKVHAHPPSTKMLSQRKS